MSQGQGKSVKLNERVFAQAVDLEINRNVMDTINLMHHITPRATEWSGVIFYKINGSYADLESLTLEVVDLVPMDIGTSTYTEAVWDFSKDATFAEKFTYWVLEAEERGEDPCEMGCIHTHHTMSAFFSGTDTDDLHENAEKTRAYLSLIVNYEMDFNKWVAKVAILAEEITIGKVIKKNNIQTKRKTNLLGDWESIIDNSDTEEEISSSSKFIQIVKCNIVKGSGDWDDYDRALEVLSNKNKPKYTSNYTQSGTHQGGIVGTGGYYTNTISSNASDDTDEVKLLKTEGKKGGAFKSNRITGFFVNLYEGITDNKVMGNQSNVYKLLNILPNASKNKFRNIFQNFGEFSKLVRGYFGLTKVTKEDLCLIAAEAVRISHNEADGASFLFGALLEYIDEKYLMEFEKYTFHTNNAKAAHKAYSDIVKIQLLQ